jgi:anti-anti-sigma factor
VQEDGLRTVTVAGELDLATADKLDAAARADGDGHLRGLVLDVGKLEFIDSSGVRLFLVLRDRAAAEGWAFSIVNLTARVRSVLKVTGLEAELPVDLGPGPS